MNHTQRIAHVARQRRYMTKAAVKEAVELYLQALAEDIASGEWVDIKGIGKIKVAQEDTNGILTSFGNGGKRITTHFTARLRTRMRLYKKFRDSCKEG